PWRLPSKTISILLYSAFCTRSRKRMPCAQVRDKRRAASLEHSYRVVSARVHWVWALINSRALEVLAVQEGLAAAAELYRFHRWVLLIRPSPSTLVWTGPCHL